jgi:hypothetical protein
MPANSIHDATGVSSMPVGRSLNRELKRMLSLAYLNVTGGGDGTSWEKLGFEAVAASDIRSPQPQPRMKALGSAALAYEAPGQSRTARERGCLSIWKVIDSAYP